MKGEEEKVKSEEEAGVGGNLERIWRSLLVGLATGSQAALGVFEGGDLCPHPPSSIEVMPGSAMGEGNYGWRCTDCGKKFDEDPYGEGEG